MRRQELARAADRESQGRAFLQTVRTKSFASFEKSWCEGVVDKAGGQGWPQYSSSSVMKISSPRMGTSALLSLLKTVCSSWQALNNSTLKED